MSSALTSIIEGKSTLVVNRTPPLPQKLDVLLGELFGVLVTKDIRPTGASSACETWRTHRFDTLRVGRHFGRDRVLRDLRLQMCLDCGAVCVRDISYDRISGLPTGGKGPARRDLVLGWYSGARRANRRHL
jgi:hypothetical protein